MATSFLCPTGKTTKIVDTEQTWLFEFLLYLKGKPTSLDFDGLKTEVVSLGPDCSFVRRELTITFVWDEPQ